MVAVVGGSGLGLLRNSGAAVGADGILGSSGLGRAAQGVTVNASTGNLIIQTQDEFLAGLGIGAAFTSSYNSLGAASGNYTNLDGSQDADGWLLDTQRKIVLTGTGNTAGSTATLTDWDGTQVVFTYNTSTGRYESAESPYNDDLLTWSANVLTWTEGHSRAVQTFASNIGGRIVSIADADGNAISFTYDAATTAGKLARVTTANASSGQNNWIDYVYGANSLTLVTSYYDLAAATNKQLSRVVYGYDATGRLSSVTTDLTPLNGGDAVSYVVTYSYKNSTSKLVTGIAQSDGTSLTIAYDASNRVSSLTQAMDSGVSQTTNFSYDTIGRVTTITDGLGGQYKMGYDAAGRLVRLEEPAPVAGGNATVKTFAYDAQGNATEALTFDNPASVGTASLAIEVTRSRFDTAGNLLERVYGDGSAALYTYGALGELLTETRYTGLDANGLADGAAPTGGMITRYIYDAAGNGVADDGSASGDDAAERHLRFAVSAEGRVSEYRYNPAGQLVATIAYTGNAYTATSWSEADLAAWVATADKSQAQRNDNLYDFRGNLIQTTSWSATDSAGAGLTTANWSRAEYTYDQAGRLLTRRVSGTNDLGGETAPATESLVYDGLGRVISATDLLGVTSTIAINDGTRTTTITTPNAATQTQVFKISGALEGETVSAAGTATATTSYAYDALGHLRMATDPSGVKTYFVYDRQGRLTATIDDNGTLSEVKYDGADRVVSSVTYAAAVSAANLALLGTVTTNTEVATIRPAASAADHWQWTIYDKTSKVLETIDGTGAVVKYDYDGAERLLATTAYSTVLAVTTLNGPDGISGYRSAPPSAVVLPAASASTDRATRNFYDNDGLLIGALDEEGYLTEVVYDKAGRKIETIGFSGVTALAQRASGTLTQLKASLALSAASDIHNYWLNDGRSRLGSVIDGEGNVTRFHYTAAGNVDLEVRGQQVGTNTAYTLATLPAASGTLETTRFYYNAAGQVTSQVRTLTGGTETTSYTYDSRGRLLSQSTSETLSSETRTQTMRYDAKGRLIGQLSGVGSAALAALGASPAQAAIDSIYATYGTQYVYDIADRLIQTITPDGSGAVGVKTLYYYDADGQLRFTINALGEVSEHRYNVLEERTETVLYGTRLSSGTLATLSGGLVTATVTTAVAAVANSGLDSKVQAAFDNRGLVAQSTDQLGVVTTYTYSAFAELLSSAALVSVNPAQVLTQFLEYGRRGLTGARTLAQNVNDPTTKLRTSYSYDAFGRSVARTLNATDQRFESWSYDRAGRITSYRDASNNQATSSYDPRSNLIASTDRAGKTTTFAYDLFGRNVTTTSAEGIVSSVKKNAYGQTILLTDGKGQTASYAYDKDGNLKSITDAVGTTTRDFDIAGRVIDVTDASGGKIHYSYDAVGRVLTEARDFGAGKLNLATTFAYDAKGQAISVTDALGVVTTYGYDLKGQKVTVVQDAGVGKSNLTTQYTYRADGKVTAQVEAFGTAQARTAQYEYDAYGRLTKTIADAGTGNNALGIAYANAAKLYYYDVDSNLIAQTDALGRTTRFVYDANNRLALTIDAEGEVVQTIYDAADRVVASRRLVTVLSSAQLAALADKTLPAQWNEVTTATNGDITITKKVRDFGTGTVTPTVAASLVANEGDRVTRTFYDGDGRAVYGVDGEGFVIQNVYDKADNVIQTIRYASQTSLTSASTTTTVAALFSTTQATGAMATNIPADAAVTQYTYDNANRLTDEVVLFDSAVGTNNDSVVTHLVLDALGQVTETHVAYGTGDVSVTKRSYDAVGRVISETRAFGANEAATTQYIYDALGQVVKAIDPRGNAAFFFYDSLCRLTWSVDAEGYVTKTEYLNGTANTKTTRYAAKASNAASLTPSTLPSVAADAARDAVSYAYYDGQDRLVWSVDAEGYAGKTTYAIDRVIASVTRYANKAGNVSGLALGALPTVTTSSADATSTFTYDLADRVKTATDAESKVESYSYDAFGNRTSVTNKLGGVTNYTYDKRGLLKSEAADQVSYDSTGAALLEGASGATRVVTSYTYDARGNVKTKVAGSNLTAAIQLITSFDYDKLERVIRQIDPAVTNVDGSGVVTPITEFAYDKRGDVVQQKVKLDAATWASTVSWFDRLGRKSAEVSPVGTLSQWTYDGAGNLTNQRIWSGAVTLPVTPGSAQPAAIGSARETQLSYDKNGRLIQTLVMGVRTGAFNGTAYVTTAGQNLQSNNEYDAFGNLTKEIDANRNPICHWFDKTGRETAKLDQEGFLTSWSRDADGNVLSETRFATRFTGTPGIAAPTVTATVDDRTTGFTYDKMGRRLTEVRNAVLVASVSGNTVSTASQAATITYAYNALGEVLSKTEATGDRADYQYDKQGRLIRQVDAIQSDFNVSGTASVRHVTYFMYDGANNLIRATERAEAGTAAANDAITPAAMGAAAAGYTAGAAGDDRITSYQYSGGKLTAQSDPLSFTRRFVYDTAGRKTLDYYTRTLSDGTTQITEGNFVTYDAAGRATVQWQASSLTAVNPVWTAIWPMTLLNYNAYGEVTNRAMRSPTSQTNATLVDLTQEQMVYDNAGRVVKSNSGDGAWKVLVYDANGNATLTLSAISADMSAGTYTIDSALTAFGAIDTSANQTMAATISLYDKRNMASATREPLRAIDSTALRYTITRARSYTAFGEVASETDARGNITEYSYNTMGRMVRSVAPTVSTTNENGSVQFVRPASDYYYDASGRLVATRDANGTYATGGTSTAGTVKAANTGNLTTRQLLAGTGYGGAEAKVAKDFRADTSVWENQYDAFGQLRVQIDGNNSQKKALSQAFVTTQYLYDKGGRVSAEVKASGYTEFYGYDQLGQRTRHWNSFLGMSVVERTDYDIQQRVSGTTDYLNHRTNYTYTWSNTAHSAGLGNFGSWIKTTTYVDAANRSMSEGTDEFGHVTTRTDLSGNITSFGFDKGGRLTSQTSTLGQSITYSYYNTGKVSQILDGAPQATGYYSSNVTSSFSYDAQGNRLTSKYDQTSYYQWGYYTGGAGAGSSTYTSNLENAAANYDALNRITSIVDPGDAANKRPSFSLARTYDANSNVRSAITAHQSIDSAQNLVTTVTTDAYWYRYDSLNRLATSKGALINGVIVRSSTGADLTYDLSGRRKSATYTLALQVWKIKYVNGVEQEYTVAYTGNSTEHYGYDGDGYLVTVHNQHDGYIDNADGTVSRNGTAQTYSL
ncbi:hypothetical protein, partial [Novosphingobium sp.]|uniref:hypothetical protein n=1 Tax=Novosphingobium sp. TaxID=1874826 RepID=UPI00286B2019